MTLLSQQITNFSLTKQLQTSQLTKNFKTLPSQQVTNSAINQKKLQNPTQKSQNSNHLQFKNCPKRSQKRTILICVVEGV
jgi:hypothetical protein